MASRTNGVEELLRRDADRLRAEVAKVDIDALLQRVVAELSAGRPEDLIAPGPGPSQQFSAETAGETPAAAAVWQATVRDGADVVLTQEGSLLQVLCLAVVIGQFWPALRVCVRRQQHPSAAPWGAGLRRG